MEFEKLRKPFFMLYSLGVCFLHRSELNKPDGSEHVGANLCLLQVKRTAGRTLK
jgi:hypothetical protein